MKFLERLRNRAKVVGEWAVRRLATASENTEEENEQAYKAYLTLLQALSKVKMSVALVIVGSLFMSGIYVIPWLGFRELNTETSSLMATFLKVLLLICLTLALNRFLFRYQKYLRNFISTKVMQFLRDEVDKKLEHVDLSVFKSYEEKYGKLDGTVQKVNESFAVDVLVAVKDYSIYVIHAVAVGWLLETWWYSVLIIAAGIGSNMVIKLAVKSNRAIGKELKEHEVNATNKAEEHTAKLKLFRVTWSHQWARKQTRNAGESWIQRQRAGILKNSLLDNLSSLIILTLVLPALFLLAIHGYQEEGLGLAILYIFTFRAFDGLDTAIQFKLQTAEKHESFLNFGRFLDLPETPRGSEIVREFGGIRLREVNFFLAGKRQFDRPLNMTIELGKPGQGNVYTLVAPSGTGKSLVLSLLARLLNKVGDVRWTGNCEVKIGRRWVDIRQTDPQSYRSAVKLVYQDTEILDGESVADNLKLGLQNEAISEEEMQGIVHQLWKKLGLAREEGKKRLLALCKAFSGGQQKRIQMGISLAAVEAEASKAQPKPVLVLLDESFSQLNAELADQLQKVILEMVSKTGGAVVMAAHNAQSIPSSSFVFTITKEGIVEKEWKEELAKDLNSRYNRILNPNRLYVLDNGQSEDQSEDQSIREIIETIAKVQSQFGCSVFGTVDHPSVVPNDAPVCVFALNQHEWGRKHELLADPGSLLNRADWSPAS